MAVFRIASEKSKRVRDQFAHGGERCCRAIGTAGQVDD
jgi:hypothetical protein